MAMKIFDVKYYIVSLKRKGSMGECASIDCWGEGDPPQRLYLYFMPSDTPLPANSSPIAATGEIEGFIYQPAERYAWYLDLLRNAGPLRARVDGDDPNRNCLMNLEMKPVGS